MKKFSDIIGQKAIIEHLYNALRTGSISHAYILSGDAGSGRKTIANIYAMALQCDDLEMETIEESSAPGGTRRSAAGTGAGGTQASSADRTNEATGKGAKEAPAMRAKTRLLEPCGKCISCMQAQSGNQPDIITITHSKNSIGVEEIRRMRADLQIKPYSSPHKIYLIPDAEKLTVQAQNALLKTLEEPPEYAVIILIANGLVNFLPTVLSRCVVLQTRAVEEAQIAQFLQKEKELPKEQAQILARFAGGNPGQALLLTDDQEFLELRDTTVDFLAHLGNADVFCHTKCRKLDFSGGYTVYYRSRKYARIRAAGPDPGPGRHGVAAHEIQRTGGRGTGSDVPQHPAAVSLAAIRVLVECSEAA